MKYQFYAIIFDVAGNTTPVGSSASPAKSFVTNIQRVTGISINPSGSLTKNIGENFTISATVSPTDANNKTINWNSTNKAVATVDSNGKVTCLSAGTTTITATAADGSGVSANLELTVRNPINSLTLDKDQTTILKDGYTSTITATTDPANYDGENITWTIADTSIATVTVSGKTATIKSTSKLGTTTLTITAGNITKTVKVTVTNFITTTYTYTGSVQQVDLPAGTYKLEVWGAQGGSGSYAGGKGGYSVGVITLSSSISLYVYVGQQGKTYSTQGSGGGATDISANKGNWYESSHLNSRIIISGGGGGSGKTSNGGYGGGNTGGNGSANNTSQGGQYGYGAYQTSGGGYHTGEEGDQSELGAMRGAFGYGGNARYVDRGTATESQFYENMTMYQYMATHGAWNGGGTYDLRGNESGGGGGGWYGGGAPGSGDYGGSGGGGSGYVYTSSTASNYSSGCLLNSSYYLTNAQTIAGNQSFPNVAGTGNETGHSGNGAAKITPIN